MTTTDKSNAQLKLERELQTARIQHGEAERVLAQALWQKQPASAARRLMNRLDHDIRDMELMLAYPPLTNEFTRQQEGDSLRKARVADDNARRVAEAQELSAPSKARKGSKEDFEAEQARFNREFPKLVGTQYLESRARELFKLGKSCGGTYETHVRRLLGRISQLRKIDF